MDIFILASSFWIGLLAPMLQGNNSALKWLHKQNKIVRIINDSSDCVS